MLPTYRQRTTALQHARACARFRAYLRWQDSSASGHPVYYRTHGRFAPALGL